MKFIPKFDFDDLIQHGDCQCDEDLFTEDTASEETSLSSAAWRWSDLISTKELQQSSGKGPWRKDGIVILPSTSYALSRGHFESCVLKMVTNLKEDDPSGVQDRYDSFSYDIRNWKGGIAAGDLSKACANFYLLESLVYLLPFNKIGESYMQQVGFDTVELFYSIITDEDYNNEEATPEMRLQHKAIKMFFDQINELENIFFHYNFYGCGHELRHNPLFSAVIGGEPKSSYAVTGLLRREFGDETVAKWFYEGFNNYSWNASYGGKKWATCANVTLEYIRGNLTKLQFIDRYWTLQHNTGSFLNKWNWDGIGMLQTILNGHHDSDFGLLHHYASKPVQDLADEMEGLFGNLSNENEDSQTIVSSPTKAKPIVLNDKILELAEASFKKSEEDLNPNKIVTKGFPLEDIKTVDLQADVYVKEFEKIKSEFLDEAKVMKKKQAYAKAKLQAIKKIKEDAWSYPPVNFDKKIEIADMLENPAFTLGQPTNYPDNPETYNKTINNYIDYMKGNGK